MDGWYWVKEDGPELMVARIQGEILQIFHNGDRITFNHYRHGKPNWGVNFIERIEPPKVTNA